MGFVYNQRATGWSLTLETFGLAANSASNNFEVTAGASASAFTSFTVEFYYANKVRFNFAGYGTGGPTVTKTYSGSLGGNSNPITRILVWTYSGSATTLALDVEWDQASITVLPAGNGDYTYIDLNDRPWDLANGGAGMQLSSLGKAEDGTYFLTITGPNSDRNLYYMYYYTHAAVETLDELRTGWVYQDFAVPAYDVFGSTIVPSIMRFGPSLYVGYSPAAPNVAGYMNFSTSLPVGSGFWSQTHGGYQVTYWQTSTFPRAGYQDANNVFMFDGTTLFSGPFDPTHTQTITGCTGAPINGTHNNFWGADYYAYGSVVCPHTPRHSIVSYLDQQAISSVAPTLSSLSMYAYIDVGGTYPEFWYTDATTEAGSVHTPTVHRLTYNGSAWSNAGVVRTLFNAMSYGSFDYNFAGQLKHLAAFEDLLLIYGHVVSPSSIINAFTDRDSHLQGVMPNTIDGHTVTLSAIPNNNYVGRANGLSFELGGTVYVGANVTLPSSATTQPAIVAISNVSDPNYSHVLTSTPRLQMPVRFRLGQESYAPDPSRTGQIWPRRTKV